MEATNINLHDLTKIPEKEFKKHFRDWMEQDDVARSLQAKLRKDLIANFNKTSLGRKIVAQAAISHRLTLSPLILALNTLVAEFLYAQNCHFTLSVFCTEVPYRNTLPDFEGARHFRFSEREVFEVFDALCTNWEKHTKDDICQEYSKEKTYSLLFVVLKSLIHKPKGTESKADQLPDVEPVHETTQQQQKSPKPDSKAEYQSNNFRYLNKYLIILSKKVKEMSQNMELMQRQRNAPQAERKSVQTRKFENLNRSLEKISENLRQMSVSRRKNKRLTTVVTAVDAMAKQFERCAINFDQISRGFMNKDAASGSTAGTEKSYNDWIKEMRTTNNGKKFLEKIESSLRKTLHREREKMERELEQRLQIQKDILKTKYKHKFTEELARHTSRGKTDNVLNVNESFEKKLMEFEAKHQELHQKIHEAEARVTGSLIPKIDSTIQHTSSQTDSKRTETVVDSKSKPKPIEIPVDHGDQLQQMVKTISEQERQIDHIVFDAKLRIQELEHESNQVDRSFRDYLERQRSEKDKMRENTTSIWQSYVLGKSMLDKKCATFRLTERTIEKHTSAAAPHVPKPPLAIPTINIEHSASANTPGFENPFRIAQRKVLARSKTLPPPLASTDTESSAEKCTRQQRPSVFRLIEHNDDDKDESRKKVAQKPPSPSLPSRLPTKVTPLTQLSPELNIKDITLEGIEISPATALSSSVRSGESNGGSSSSPRGVFKLRRQLFTATDNGGPSSGNGQQMNSNGNKEAEKPLKQINKANGGDRKKSIGGGAKDAAAVNKETSTIKRKQNGDGNRNSEGHFEGPRGDNLDALSAGVEEDGSSQSVRLDITTGEAGTEKESDNDFWA